MRKFIFDVDGTLTPSRQKIDGEFLSFFMEFSSNNDVYLVTGSDRDKTLEQIGEELYNKVCRVYNCSGSDVYEGDKNIYRDDWELPEYVEERLLKELEWSEFPIRNGNHIERRPGGVNFSILGRGEGEGREQYVEWDNKTHERRELLCRLRYNFIDVEFNVGGQTGIDIAPIGVNKSQILRDFNKEDELHFFGDMMERGQNDYPLAYHVEKWGGFTYPVKDWEDTRTKLTKLTEDSK